MAEGATNAVRMTEAATADERTRTSPSPMANPFLSVAGTKKPDAAVSRACAQNTIYDYILPEYSRDMRARMIGDGAKSGRLRRPACVGDMTWTPADGAANLGCAHWVLAGPFVRGNAAHKRSRHIADEGCPRTVLSRPPWTSRPRARIPATSDARHRRQGEDAKASPP